MQKLSTSQESYARELFHDHEVDAMMYKESLEKHQHYVEVNGQKFMIWDEKFNG